MNEKFFHGLLKYTALFLYYGIARFLPPSKTPLIGNLFKKARYYCCRNIFLSCGTNVNVERMAYFGRGFKVTIGDNSGLGINCVVPSDIIVGNDVMMGPNVHIFSANHRFDRIDLPMNRQGHLPRLQTVIEDDVWIGMNVIFTPGRIVKKGTIIGAGTVLTKDFDAYSVVGGNPSKILKSRLNS